MSGVRVPAAPPNFSPSRVRLRRVEPVLRGALAGACRVRPGSRLLIAVSGGADSTALLLGLWRLARSRGDVVGAAHLDHGLRGAESREDARFVARLCAALDVPLIAGRCDASAKARARGFAGQDGLRRVRRAFLAGAARRFRADAIATAHTADDQLETLLLRLGRGAGLTGLAGMAPRRGRWIKPLLECPRMDLEHDLRAAGITWREDRSNRSRAYARNRVRRDVVPALARALWPDVEAARARRALARRAVRAAESARSAARALSSAADLAVASGLERSGDVTRLPIASLRALDPAVRVAAWRRINRMLLPHGPAWTCAHHEALEALVRGPARGPVSLPGGLQVRTLQTTIEWGVRSIEGHGEIAVPGRDLSLVVPGRVAATGLHVTARWIGAREARTRLSETPSAVQYFAASGLRGGLRVRTASEDESFTPFGRSRPVRLGSFLKKQQHPAAQRRHPTVLADASGILWVIGVRRSARAPLGPGTRKVLRVHAERHD